MADINKNIDINVNTNVNTDGVNKLNDGLDKVVNNQTKITHSTNLHTEATNANRKSVLENGGAMGLLSAATSGMAMDFKDAIEAIGLSTDSLKTFRGALAATGIGVAALVILELIQNWDKWVGVIDGSTAAMEKLNSQYEEFMFYKDRDTLSNDRLLALSQARGESEEKQYKIAIENSVALVKSLEEQIQLAAKLSAEEYKRSGNSEEFKKLRQDEINLEKEKFKAETAALVVYENEKTRLRNKGVEEQKKITQTLIDEQKKLLSINAGVAKQSLDSIVNINKSINDIINAKFGSTYNTLSQLSKLWYDNTDAINNYNDSFKGLTTNYEKAKNLIISSATLDAASKQEQLKSLKTLYDDEKSKILQNISLLKLKGNTTEQINTLYIDTSKKLGKILSEELGNFSKRINDNTKEAELLGVILSIKENIVRTNNRILSFDDDIDGRLNNSNKFLDIEQQINDTYTDRERLLDNTLKIDIEKKKSEYNTSVETSKRLEAQKESEVERLKKMGEGLTQEEIFKSDSIQKQQKVVEDAQAKQIANAEETSKKLVELTKATGDYELELFTLKSDKEYELEKLNFSRKQMLRNEDLARQRMYYDAVLNIANESSGLLDALITNGHLKGKKDAENALILRKATGVASVVISGQEEIRGIWANPALTALPDAGVSTKTALTAAAVIKHGLSIGTILAQKLNGSASTNSGGNGGGGTASFTTIGTSSTNQLAATIGAQQQKPIRTYLVGSDIKTMDALDRNIQSNATFI